MNNREIPCLLSYKFHSTFSELFPKYAQKILYNRALQPFPDRSFLDTATDSIWDHFCFATILTSQAFRSNSKVVHCCYYYYFHFCQLEMLRARSPNLCLPSKLSQLLKPAASEIPLPPPHTKEKKRKTSSDTERRRKKNLDNFSLGCGGGVVMLCVKNCQVNIIIGYEFQDSGQELNQVSSPWGKNI